MDVTSETAGLNLISECSSLFSPLFYHMEVNGCHLPYLNRNSVIICMITCLLREAEQHFQFKLKEILKYYRRQNEKETQQQEKAKKKKPKLLNKFDKGIKVELDAAEKLRKKGKAEEALKEFEKLVSKYPQSPRARYGKAQSEDDLAEKMRSNEMLQQSISTYGEVATLPNVPNDLIKLTLKRRADRQQFLGHMRGSLVTLQKLVNLFPNDTSFKNNLGVGYLLIGDNSNAKTVYEEVRSFQICNLKCNLNIDH
ncbi:Aspartyl/asparaginyl beta-hydroxylase [Varanus komodoensis]|nr:Aspartyl/asparaginyl beta-hydroxylase [Varanus komodoensis]